MIFTSRPWALVSVYRSTCVPSGRRPYRDLFTVGAALASLATSCGGGTISDAGSNITAATKKTKRCDGKDGVMVQNRLSRMRLVKKDGARKFVIRILAFFIVPA